MKKQFDIFDLLKRLEDKNEQVCTLFSGDDFLGEEISILWAIIESQIGIESSDVSAEILGGFGCGEITKKSAIKKLRKLR